MPVLIHRCDLYFVCFQVKTKCEQWTTGENQPFFNFLTQQHCLHNYDQIKRNIDDRIGYWLDQFGVSRPRPETLPPADTPAIDTASTSAVSEHQAPGVAAQLYHSDVIEGSPGQQGVSDMPRDISSAGFAPSQSQPSAPRKITQSITHPFAQ